MNKFFIIIFLFFLSIKAFANPNIQARTGILIDYHSDEILYELDPDTNLPSINDKNYDINYCF